MRRASSRTSRIKTRAAWCCFVFAPASWLSAQPAGVTAVTPKPMPDETTAALVVRDGAAWRAHNPTRRVLGAMLEAGAADPLRAAWTELAGSLGLGDAAAFDTLMGTRAWAARGEGEGVWAVASWVSPATANRLESRLDAAPRGFEGGKPVMLVEKGAYRLGRDEIARADGTITMTLAPNPRQGVSDATAWMPACMNSLDSIAGAAAAAFFLRVDATNYVRGTIDREERGWNASFAGTAGLMGLTDAGAVALAGLPPMGDGGGIRADEGDVLLEIAGRIPRIEAIREEGTSELRAALALMGVTPPAKRLVGERALVRVTREESGGLAVLMAFEVEDRRGASAYFDSILKGAIGLAAALPVRDDARGARKTVHAELTRELGRVKDDPDAVRLVVLGAEEENGKAHSKGGTMAWTSMATLPLEHGKPDAGWWVMEFRGSCRERDEAERSLVAWAQRLGTLSWGRTLLRIRTKPAGLFEAFGGGAEALVPGPFSLIADFDLAELEVEASRTGVSGKSRATLREPRKDAPPASR